MNFFFLSQWLGNWLTWVTGYTPHSDSHVRVQWVISPLSIHASFHALLTGWPGPQFCTPRESNSEPHGPSPTNQTTQPRVVMKKRHSTAVLILKHFQTDGAGAFVGQLSGHGLLIKKEINESLLQRCWLLAVLDSFNARCASGPDKVYPP